MIDIDFLDGKDIQCSSCSNRAYIQLNIMKAMNRIVIPLCDVCEGILHEAPESLGIGDVE